MKTTPGNGQESRMWFRVTPDEVLRRRYLTVIKLALYLDHAPDLMTRFYRRRQLRRAVFRLAEAFADVAELRELPGAADAGSACATQANGQAESMSGEPDALARPK
jgi:hypothetical protein